MQELEELQRNAQPSTALISVQDLYKIRPVNTVTELTEREGVRTHHSRRL